VEAVFVYGTLKRGERNHPLVADHLLRAVPGYVEGFALYHLPPGGERPYAYPAMVPGEGRVFGEVLFLQEEALPLLDALEEEGVEYRRVRVRVRTAEGEVEAWTYLYLEEPQGVLLPEGVWRGEA
jgi:gamma-glutamylcyclotransferase (GGCT)/AIG2-like uncharacterized protein YtfP